MTDRPGNRSFGYPECVISGVLWAVVVTVSQSMSELPHDLDASGYLQVFVGLVISYAGGGVLMSIAAVMIEARESGRRAWGVAALAVLGAIVLHIGFHFMAGHLWPGMGPQAMFTFVPDIREYVAILCWVSWVTTLFGGIYMGALILFLRSARRQQQSRRAETARLLAESRVEHALAQDRTRLIQPVLVLDSLGELGRRYLIDPDRADALLDTLVLFLRGAATGDDARTRALAHELERALSFTTTEATPS